MGYRKLERQLLPISIGYPPNTVMLCHGHEAAIRVLSGPLLFLTRFVDDLAAMWGGLPVSRTLYEHSLHTELAVYIESRVARSLGHNTDVARRVKAGSNKRPIGPTLTMVGGPPYDRGVYLDFVAKLKGSPESTMLTAPAVINGQEPNLLPSDGFTLLDSADAGQAWRNIEDFRNECSPFSRIEDAPSRDDGRLLVDSYYGRAFDFRMPRDAALYGCTDGLKAAYANVAARANDGFLSVPYRIVPRIRVRSRAEIEKLYGEVLLQASRSLVGMELLWRGQTREYTLWRHAASTNLR